jgi:hypothetical protein
MLSIVFAPYDDEGYVLVSVREFLAGRPLYNEVFTQYGPTYFAYRHLLSLVQGTPTHDLTRLTTLGTWMCAATLLGLAALWLTRSGLAGIAVFCASSMTLRSMVGEPGHPQELLVAFTALSVAVAASPMKTSSRLTLLAAISALACLTKINVGMFIGLATLAAALPLARATTRTLFALALGAFPILLMWPNLGTWAWPYALACSAGITTAVAMRPATRVEVWTFRSRASLLAAFVAPAALVCIYVFARHTTVASLLDGILFRPARMSNLIVAPLQVPVEAVVVSLAAAGVAMYAMHSGPHVLQHAEPILPLLKVGVGLYIILAGAKPAEIVGGSAAIVLALLLWRSSSEHEPFGRSFLALSAALHTGTAYPVAGSQMAWATFLLIVAAYVCLWDGLAGLRSTITAVPSLNRVLATGLFCGAAAVYYASLTPLAGVEAASRNRIPLPFTGASSIRLEHNDVATYNWVTQNLKGHCSAFVTLPGYGSFYPWSGMRPPTGYNNGAWMILVNDAEQRKTVERMRETSRPCAVYHPPGGGSWTSQPLEGRPLVDYVMALSPVASHAGFELRTSPEQAATWDTNYLQFGNRSYNEAEVYPVPAELVNAPTLRLWLKGDGQGGTIIGAQSTTTQGTLANGSWCPMIYLGTDGRLRAEFWNGAIDPITTANRVDDRRWHHVVIVKRADGQRLYVDGAFIGETAAAAAAGWATFMQLGTGFTWTWPSGNGSWFPFRGELRDVAVTRQPWNLDDVSRDYLTTRDR